MKLSKLTLFAVIALLGMVSCKRAGGKFQGTEYMPDMAHPVTYEANYYNYYKLNRWGSEEEYHKLVQPSKPIEGTIPRGYAGLSGRSGAASNYLAKQMQGYPVNGYTPYYFGEGDSARALAMAAITKNPFPATKKRLAQGKELYGVYCGVCHGEQADGNGYLVREDGGKYPAQPANLVNEEFSKASEGRFYHAIMRGWNMMGGYADKLSYEERWNVIHYIRSLQAAKAGVPYAMEEELTFKETNIEQQVAEILAAREKHAAADAAPKAIRLNNVFFATGSDVLREESQDELNKLVAIMTQYPQMAIEVGGHTDDQGDDKANLDLSGRRAKSVQGYLVKKGIDVKRLAAVGYGESKPVADNKTDEGRAQNRRTEFVIK